MKKSLIALAALGAFAGAASAQSSVTLYGLIDLNYQYIKGGDLSPLGDNDLNRLADGHVYGPGSRWGLRVSEDLGSGLKANVVLESGFNGDVGSMAQSNATTSRLFGRQAFVSLASNTLGEIRLGRQYILHDEVQALNNPFGNSTVLNPGAGANTTTAGAFSLFIDAPRIDNAVQYISPSFAGFRLQGMVAAGEGTADRYQGVKAVYANGPLNVALSYEQSKARVPVAGVDDVNKIIALGANYDFGVAKVFAGYQQGEDLTTGVGTQIGTLTLPGLGGAAATEMKAYTVGASVPLGAFTVGANYTASKWENAVGADVDLKRAGVVGTYALSKLTTVYAGYSQAMGDLKNDVSEKNVFQLGLRKAF
ncbi:porin [uncultured Azohydromonas sp.]|jgi:Outer membrane protein (porin)|uniref:porin n=1 Tax=uncultured Azohydromonas sp. TaxID=487342 RepID=UPI0026197D8F|nr:porin [uncultured Azohydromonas sp.]